jgi:hypothetical protein
MAMLLLIPLALAEELQPGAIDHQVRRAVRDDLRSALAKSRLRRLNVVWSGKRSSCPSSRRRRAAKLSAWRRARWETSRSINTNSIAASEYGLARGRERLVGAVDQRANRRGRRGRF